MNQDCKIIPIGVPKGGTGKTTLCELLAVEAAHRGKRVLIIDCDDETENAYKFVTSRIDFNERQTMAGQPTVPKIECIKKSLDKIDIRDEILHEHTDNFDYIFIDNHPNAKQTFRFLCQIADVVLFPIEYTDKSIDIIPKMAALMDDVNKSIRFIFPEFKRVPVLAIINKASAVRRRAIQDAKEIVRAFKNDFILAETIVIHRSAYQKTRGGLTVSDTGEKGRATVQLLLDEIDKLTN